MRRDLENKVILITGGSSGIGAATAEACARAGMDLCLVARRADKLQQVADRVAALGRKAHVCVADVSDPEQIGRAVEDGWEALGRLDAVFANAGYGQEIGVLDMEEQDERAMFETNYFATTHLFRLALPKLMQSEGGLRHLLACSSAASEIGLPMLGVYSATKAAQDSVCGAMRAELRKQGVSVTSVHPIGTKTEFMAVAAPDTGGENKNTPGMFQQTPERVANKIVKALRRPVPEVWPSVMTRYGLALGTAWPGFAAWAMRRHYKKITR
ncbi:MAG: SDR family NAD(P)-dependent oxidoreductase [Planctomycetota bacterium]